MDIKNVTLDIKLIDINFNTKTKHTPKKYDTWDLLSLRFFENEKYLDSLIYANKELDIDMFLDCNCEIKIPEIKKESINTLPPWRL